MNISTTVFVPRFSTLHLSTALSPGLTVMFCCVWRNTDLTGGSTIALSYTRAGLRVDTVLNDDGVLVRYAANGTLRLIYKPDSPERGNTKQCLPMFLTKEGLQERHLTFNSGFKHTGFPT